MGKILLVPLIKEGSVLIYEVWSEQSTWDFCREYCFGDKL